MWTHRHLLGIAQLSRDDVLEVFERADGWLAAACGGAQRVRPLHGRTVVNLFFDACARTCASFEVASKRLGADVISMSPQASSIARGESLLDTVKSLDALGADAIVIRHPASGAPEFVAAHIRASIVNGGDGAHEHPTQALVDALTIRRHGKKFEGLVVLLCGDVLHSSLARSHALLLGGLGAEVRFCSPRTLMPRAVESLGPTVRGYTRLVDAIADADVVVTLGIQNDRQRGVMIPSAREYARTFGLNARVLARAKSDALVMRSGPIDRGVEMDPRVADGSQSVVVEQVEAGVAVRMAVLESVVRAADRARSSG
jgi:aspartate carbamoyltransferase catalytic subunit